MHKSNFQQYETDFSGDGFLGTFKKYAKRIGKVPLHQCICLYLVITEGKAPLKAKTIAVGALTYLGIPVDAIPDLTPVAGVTDDIALIASAFTVLSLYITPVISKKATQMLPSWLR